MFKVYVETNVASQHSAGAGLADLLGPSKQLDGSICRTYFRPNDAGPIEVKHDLSNLSRQEAACDATPWAWKMIYSQRCTKPRARDTATTASSLKSRTETFARKLRKNCSAQKVDVHSQLSSRVPSVKHARKKWPRPPGSSEFQTWSKFSFSESSCPSDGKNYINPIQGVKRVAIKSYLERTKERAESHSRAVSLAEPRNSIRELSARSRPKPLDLVSTFSGNDLGTFRSSLSNVSCVSRRTVRLKEYTDTGLNNMKII
jgi:hypothetical protein